ncbi:MAG: thymidylate synthase [Ilumatobacteraceae bacterium]|nr:thymidylate synthase [Ilumatobacteraceae bacterium]
MLDIRCDSANELFAASCRAVRQRGTRSAPRGMGTTEVLGAHLCLTRPRHRFVDLPPTRILNPAFAVAETLWIISGSDDPWIFDYNGSLAQYADNGRLQGAYGPRIRNWRGAVDQLDHVRTLLTRDRDSRQGVIQIYDAERDTCGHRDVPCTLGHRFFLRDGRLHLYTTMRSQDLWLGFPYDIITNTLILELMAGWLGADLGEYHHYVDSLHLYDQHLDRAETSIANAELSSPMPDMTVSWSALSNVLAATLADEPSAEASAGWTSFAHTLASYRIWKAGEREKARTLITNAGNGLLPGALIRWYDHLETRQSAVASLAG